MEEKFLVATDTIAIGDHIFQPGAIFQVAGDDAGNGGYQCEYAPLYDGEPLEKNVHDMEEMLFIPANAVVAASTWVEALRESFTNGDDEEHRGGCETVAEFVEAWE